MSFKQRANIKFCLKIGKTFTETFQLMKQVYGDDCLMLICFYDSKGIVHKEFVPPGQSDFYLFGKMHLPMKGKRYADVEAI